MSPLLWEPCKIHYCTRSLALTTDLRLVRARRLLGARRGYKVSLRSRNVCEAVDLVAGIDDA